MIEMTNTCCYCANLTAQSLVQPSPVIELITHLVTLTITIKTTVYMLILNVAFTFYNFQLPFLLHFFYLLMNQPMGNCSPG